MKIGMHKREAMKYERMQSTTVEVPTELIGRVTTTVAATAKILGIGLNQCYASVKDGTIPSIRLQGRYVIPVAGLLKMLRINEPHDLGWTVDLNRIASETGPSPEHAEAATQAGAISSDGDRSGAHAKIARR